VRPLYVCIELDPKKCDLSSKGHLTKQKKFCCFRYFYIKMNTFQGYSHSKSIFRLKSTHPTACTVKKCICVFSPQSKKIIDSFRLFYSIPAPSFSSLKYTSILFIEINICCKFTFWPMI
jgi:hypothetical protein